MGNIDKDIEQQMLYDYFAAVVKPEGIESVNLKRDFMNMSESKGFAFITFTNPGDAIRAKNALNHSKIKENQITISFLRNKDGLGADQEAQYAKSNLFFKKLNKEMTSKELEDLCAPYGNIICSKLRFDSQGHSLGYGYVQFDKESSANDCIEALNGKNVQESIIEVMKFSPASKRGTINQKCNIYVKDFPLNWNEKQVTEFIEKEFGKGGKVKITSKCVAKDQKKDRFYAFVAFETPEITKEAIDTMKDKEFPNETNKLFVDFAMTKEERRKKLRDMHQRTKNETNLFIKSLAKEVTEDRLKKVFERFGIVTSVCIKSHELNRTAAPPGAEKKVLKFGFINFQTPTDAAKALGTGKSDPEVKALIDPTHYPQVEFLHMHQPKTVRFQFNKMDQKNKRSMAMYDKQLNLFKQMFNQMNRGQSGQKSYGNRNMQQGGRKPGMDQQMMNPAAFAGMMGPAAMAGMAGMMNPMFMQQSQFGIPQVIFSYLDAANDDESCCIRRNATGYRAPNAYSVPTASKPTGSCRART